MIDKNKLVVAVLGAGVMGRQIVSLFASQKVKCLLYDRTVELAKIGIEKALSVKIVGREPIFALPDSKDAGLVQLLSSEDDKQLALLKDADLIIEAVTEDLQIKEKIFKRIWPFRKSGAVLASNTSGLTKKTICKNMPEGFERSFCILHFFNPTRVMPLVEVVVDEKNDSSIKEFVFELIQEILGKKIVWVKDTPNFVANRVGIQGLLAVLKYAKEMGIPISVVDKLFGPILGRSVMGILKTCDFVGNDTVCHVAQNFVTECPDDPAVKSGLMETPACLKYLLEKNFLGNKTGDQGFYIKKGKGKNKEYWELDLNSLAHNKSLPFVSEPYKAARKNFRKPVCQIRSLVYDNPQHIHSKFVWKSFMANALYTVQKLYEMADDLVSIDNAMKWGYNWKIGLFELWDMLGLKRTLLRLQEEGEGNEIPDCLWKMLESGCRKFYLEKNGERYFYDFKTGKYHKEQVEEKHISLKRLHLQGHTIAKNWSTKVIDLGDGVACLQLDSCLQKEMHPIDGWILEMLHEVRQIVQERGYKGLVIGTDTENFCAGANVDLILGLAKAKQWKRIEEVSRMLQEANMNLRYGNFPVVTTPHGKVLGGGYEMASASVRMVAPMNTYFGLVEPALGLVPAGCGCLWLLLNQVEKFEGKNPGPNQIAKNAFTLVGTGQLGYSAQEAKKLGYMRLDDIIVASEDELIWAAKQEVLKLADGYKPLVKPETIQLPGKRFRVLLEAEILVGLVAGKCTQYEVKIGNKLAYIFTGGDKASANNPVPIEYILELEREAFVSLCGEPKTQERIEYFLKEHTFLHN